MEEKKIKAKHIASIEDKTVHKILCLCKNGMYHFVCTQEVCFLLMLNFWKKMLDNLFPQFC